MDTRKVTLIATITAIALVAVGIGYAYTASTLNSSNVANSEYVTLVQGDATAATTGAYNFAAAGTKIIWDSVDAKNGEQTGDNAAKTTFSLSTSGQTVKTDVITGYSLVKVGKSFDVLTQYTGPTPAATLNISIVQSGFTNEAVEIAGTDDVFFFLKVTVDGNSVDTGKVFYFKLIKPSDAYVFQSCDASGVVEDQPVNTFAVDKGTTTDNKTPYKTATIEVYYGHLTSDAIEKTHALNVQPIGPKASVLNSASLTFGYNSSTA